jgi:hypothetical protein
MEAVFGHSAVDHVVGTYTDFDFVVVSMKELLFNVRGLLTKHKTLDTTKISLSRKVEGENQNLTVLRYINNSNKNDQ